MSTDIFSSREGVTDATSDKARRAVRKFRAMQPSLSAFARVLTGNPEVRVVMDARSNGMTDGKRIFFRPPIALGDNTPHDRSLCDKRDDNLQLLCPACNVLESVYITIYHEIGHIAFDTFEKPSPEDQAKLLERAVREAGGKYSEAIARRIGNAPQHMKDSYLGMAGLISPFLPFIVNALDDARVNRSVFRSRKGTKVMFDADVKRVFAKGVEQRDGVTGEIKHVEWREYPLNQQAAVGLFCRASGYDYRGWFVPEVEAFLDDKVTVDLCRQIETVRSLAGVFELAFPLLDNARKFGFFKNPNDPEVPEEEQEKSDEAQDQGQDTSPEDQGASGNDAGPSDQDEGADPSSASDDSSDNDEDGEGESSEGEGSGSSESDQDGIDGGGSDSDADSHDEGGQDSDGDDAGADSPSSESQGQPGVSNDAESDSSESGSDSSDDGQTGSSSDEQAEGSGSEGSDEGVEEGADVPQDSDQSDGTTGGSNASDNSSDDDGESGTGGSSTSDGSHSDQSADGSESDVDTEASPPGNETSRSETAAAGEAGTETSGPDEEELDGVDEPTDTQEDGTQDSGDGTDSRTGDGDEAGSRPEGNEDDGLRDDAGHPESDVARDSEGDAGADLGEGSSLLATGQDGDSVPPDSVAPDDDDDDDEEVDGPDSDLEAPRDSGDGLREDEGPEGDSTEPLDSGADEGLGGTRVIEDSSFDTIPLGMPEDVERGIHEIAHPEDRPEFIEENGGDVAEEMERAVIQGLYFETPSRNIFGVREHHYGDPVEVDGYNMSQAWDHSSFLSYGYNRRQLGVEGDFETPETILGPALLRMRVAFSDNQRGKDYRNRKSGKVDPRVLGKRAHHDDERLFKTRVLPKKKDYFVLIGIDISGSTVGKNIMLAKRAAFAQATLCHRLGIKFAVYAHSGNYHAPSDGRRSGLDLDVYHIKDPDEPWTEAVQERLLQIGPDAVNLDGHTMEYYRKVLDTRRETHCVMLYYTDGKMPAENYDEELEILQREIRICRRKKYTLVGVGIRTDSPTQHGLDTVQVNGDEDILTVVKHLERRLLAL